MLTDTELAAMRSTAEAAMPDTVTIRRPASGGTLNVDTGVWSPATAEVVYQGKARVRVPDARQVEVLFGDRQLTETRFVATIPADAGPVRVGDVVTLDETSDPHGQGRTMRVTNVPGGSWEIARRLACEESSDAVGAS